MTDNNSTISHLSVAEITMEADNMQHTDGSSIKSLPSSDFEFYFQWAVVLIGVLGTAGNSLILYALVASEQHKKHVLIVNQNALDLFGCIFLIVTYSLKLCDLRLTGAFGYWLCITLLSEDILWWGTNGSMVNLAMITIDRYLKVVHPLWSRKRLRPWMIHSAMAFAWFAGIVFNTAVVLNTSTVIDGVCYTFVLFDSRLERIATAAIYVMCFYVIILVIVIFCYGRILVALRHRARVMASHSTAGSNTAPSQSKHIQSNVIKTMILVSTFYAIAYLPINFYILLMAVDPDSTLVDGRYYAAVFIAFFCSCTNPFIYATKFSPVKQILRDIIPHNIFVNSATGNGTEEAMELVLYVSIKNVDVRTLRTQNTSAPRAVYI